MNPLMAVTLATNILTAGLELVSKAQQIQLIAAKAASENRDLTAEEVKAAEQLDTDARSRLDAAIKAHQPTQ